VPRRVARRPRADGQGMMPRYAAPWPTAPVQTTRSASVATAGS
jgi:hypothetical protein